LKAGALNPLPLEFGSASGPAKLLVPPIIDAEMVADFVDDGFADEF
jgi:hypothetical protein